MFHNQPVNVEQSEVVNAAKHVAQDNAEKAAEGYKLTSSKSGNNLYVENKEYDPLEKHRSREKGANKGEGLSILCCCFGRSKVVEATEADKARGGMDRMYSLQANASK